MGILSGIVSGGNLDAPKNIFDFLSGIYSLAALLPGFGASVRRLHDIDKSAWWILINFIPFVGQIWYIVLMCLDGQPGTNQWGTNPKEINPVNF